MPAVGRRVFPYSECRGTPATVSERTASPSAAVPRNPCSGVNTAASVTPGVSRRTSNSIRPSRRREV